MDVTFLSRSEHETQRLGQRFARALTPEVPLLLSGDLGAGKTQFTKGVASVLGVSETVTSPTFAILSLHDGEMYDLAHFDLYRLEEEQMLEDISYWEMLDSDVIVVAEWGDKFPHALPEEYIHITFQITGETERMLAARSCGDKAHGALAKIKSGAE